MTGGPIVERCRSPRPDGSSVLLGRCAAGVVREAREAAAEDSHMAPGEWCPIYAKRKRPIRKTR